MPDSKRPKFTRKTLITMANTVNFQTEKKVISAFQTALDSATREEIPDVLNRYCAPGLLWRGFHPFNQINGADQVARQFWQPLKRSLTRLQNRVDILFAGQNSLCDSDDVWVVSMGHLTGLFDTPWLGIRPTGKMAFLRYCAFYKIVEERIVETAMYFDIPHLMAQAGQSPFPPQTAAHLVQPGPRTHDGLLLNEQPANEGEKTLAVINTMLSDLGQWDSGVSLEDELARTWHDDIFWWGPAGIGATYTIERYARQHSGPFRACFSNRSRTSHCFRLAEGH